MKTWKEFIKWIDEIINSGVVAGYESDPDERIDTYEGWGITITGFENMKVAGFTIDRWNCEVLDCIVNRPREDLEEIVYVHWTEDEEDPKSMQFFGVLNTEDPIERILDPDEVSIMMQDLFDWIHSLKEDK